MDVLSLGSPSKGVEAELVVGDKQEDLNVQVGDVENTSAEQVGDRVENQQVTNYVQNIPMDYLWLLILAVMLPSPSAVGKTIWNGFLIVIGRRKDDK